MVVVDETRREVADRVRGAVVACLTPTTARGATEPSVTWALEEAVRHGTRLVVVACVDGDGTTTPCGTADRRDARDRVQRAVEEATRGLPAARTSGLVLPGRWQEWLAGFATGVHCLVLDGRAGLTARAVAGSSRPVVLVPPVRSRRPTTSATLTGTPGGTSHDDGASDDVVVGFDGSAGGWAAARWGAREAVLRGAAVVLLRAYRSTSGWASPERRDWLAAMESVGHQEDLAAAAGELSRAHPGLAVRPRVVVADSATAVLTSAPAGVVVVGARGLWACPGEVGWTATAVARSAGVPVVVVPPDSVVDDDLGDVRLRIWPR